MTMTPVGSTSRWIAAGRALESESADPLFRDRFARELAGEPGFALLASMRAAMGMPNAKGPEPYFSIRTRFFDDAMIAAVHGSSIAQVVILGAGMDTRAFRLEWPHGLVLFEVDREDVFDRKEAVLARLEARPTYDRRVVRADESGPWTLTLNAAGFDAARPTAFLVEGLLYYLSAGAVSDLLNAIGTLACD
jgi:methyltransferase (TIGR00027 family)